MTPSIKYYRATTTGMARHDANRQATPPNGDVRAGSKMSTDGTHRRSNAGTDSIVPEDFNLEAARKAPTTTPDHEIPRCPRCESASIRHRSGGLPNNHSFETLYRCKICDHRFDHPEVGSE